MTATSGVIVGLSTGIRHLSRGNAPGIQRPVLANGRAAQAEAPVRQKKSDDLLEPIVWKVEPETFAMTALAQE
jgi:hypothetical protein